jgi:hypothetical protein
MALRAIWQFMDRDVTHKIVYGPKRILWVIDWSINCHLAGSAVNYLLCYTQYMQICQTTCFCYCISKTKTGSDKIRKKTLYWSGPVHIIQLLHLNEINMRFYEATLSWQPPIYEPTLSWQSPFYEPALSWQSPFNEPALSWQSHFYEPILSWLLHKWVIVRILLAHDRSDCQDNVG